MVRKSWDSKLMTTLKYVLSVYWCVHPLMWHLIFIKVRPDAWKSNRY